MFLMVPVEMHDAKHFWELQPGKFVLYRFGNVILDPVQRAHAAAAYGKSEHFAEVPLKQNSRMV